MGDVARRVRALDAQFQNAGFKAQASDSILLRMWEKWVLLATVGSVTCLMRGTVGEVEASSGRLRICAGSSRRMHRGGDGGGVSPREPFVKTAKGMITARGSGFASSMFRDMGAGAPIEADQIVAGPASAAHAATASARRFSQSQTPTWPSTRTGSGLCDHATAAAS